MRTPHGLAVLLVAARGAASQSCPGVEQDTNYSGDDLNHTKASSADKCCYICNSVSTCKYWTFQNHKCFMKTGKGTATKNGGDVSGARGVVSPTPVPAPPPPTPAPVPTPAPAAPTPAPTPPPPPQPAQFNSPFGSYMMLQREPAAAAVYGTAGIGGTAVHVTITSTPGATAPSASYTVPAAFDIATGEWKAMLKPTAAGGDFSIAAECTGCVNTTTPVLEHVTFGDVWYCSGQSNMELSMQHTFHRNYTRANISLGKYDNIRLQKGSQSGLWMTAKQSVAGGNKPDLFQFSAACWYFAETLTNELKASGQEAVPLGLISTAVGGTQISDWIPKATRIASCSHTSNGSNGWRYAEHVAPYLNMTLKGFLWYQGENDMGGLKGNSKVSTGYACEMQALVKEWRAAWSVVPGTTDPNAPFGLVVLPGSGSEGGKNMGAMRIAQTASYGVVPNPALPNTFLAQAYDLNDPWGSKSCDGWQCCPHGQHKYNLDHCNQNLNKSKHHPGDCDRYCAVLAGTMYYMGAIHPRDKYPVGLRLGKAAMAQVYGGTGAATGATIAGCSYTPGAPAVTVSFNKTLLGADTLRVQQLDATLSPFEVLTDASMFCVEPVGDKCTDGTVPPAPLPAAGDDAAPPFGGGPSPFLRPGLWKRVPVRMGRAAGTVEADLSAVNGTVAGIRYAWTHTSCCKGSIKEPCDIERCPIMSTPSGFPANPFAAKVVNGKCSCVAPQVCDQ